VAVTSHPPRSVDVQPQRLETRNLDARHVTRWLLAPALGSAAAQTYQRAAGLPVTGRADGITVAFLLRYEK
jgi:hypothetical protein